MVCHPTCQTCGSGLSPIIISQVRLPELNDRKLPAVVSPSYDPCSQCKDTMAYVNSDGYSCSDYSCHPTCKTCTAPDSGSSTPTFPVITADRTSLPDAGRKLGDSTTYGTCTACQASNGYVTDDGYSCATPVCHPTCDTCTAPSSPVVVLGRVSLPGSEGRKLTTTYGDCTKCKSKSAYLSSDDYSCTACPAHCATCTSDTECQSCKSGYTLDGSNMCTKSSSSHTQQALGKSAKQSSLKYDTVIGLSVGLAVGVSLLILATLLIRYFLIARRNRKEEKQVKPLQAVKIPVSSATTAQVEISEVQSSTSPTKAATRGPNRADSVISAKSPATIQAVEPTTPASPGKAFTRAESKVGTGVGFGQ